MSLASSASQRFAALPTAAKLLLILTAALLPIGLALMWMAQDGVREANNALRERTQDAAADSARAIESLVARNALALRVAANGALAGGEAQACDRARRALSIAPAVEQDFQLHDMNGRLLCQFDQISAIEGRGLLVAPGDILVRVGPNSRSLILRVGVVGGMATGRLSQEEIHAVAAESGARIESVSVSDAERVMAVIGTIPQGPGRAGAWFTDIPIANGQLTVHAEGRAPRITGIERLLISLPLLMWVTAALLTWVLVSSLLIRPLRRLHGAVSRFEPCESANTLPRKLGPTTEIQELRDAFSRAVSRVEESDREMSAALDGQRRLVREVHHRVKNNLQVVASLLNIHGRNTESGEARSAYAAIARRVGALSIVHRNHFAEMEENRGIALRPLLSELAAELRASAPEHARRLAIDLDVETTNTTQDVAVSVAFLVTEIVEFAMLRRPEDPVEISLRRTGDLTARLTIGSPVLVPEGDGAAEKLQFERIVAGLAKQLRSTLDRKLGRYSVDLPVFPPV